MTQKETLRILKMGKNVFLTGPAGSGKTHALDEYIKYLKNNDVGVAVTASTGIAATHLKGVTIHSWSGIGIKDDLTDYDLDDLEQRSYLWKRFDNTQVLIIDEISMLSAPTLDCVDRVAKLFKRNEEPFGGMQVIFSGDFFQLPPIENKKPQNNMNEMHQEQIIFLDADEDEEEVSTTPFAFKSRAWKDAELQICYLSEQFRQKDNHLSAILSEIRTGKVSNESLDLLKSRILEKDDDEITKLFTHNMNVDNFNNQKIREIDQEEKTYKMDSKGKSALIPALKKGCLVPENLMLKKDALVMFVKNNPNVGYVNGTIGRVVSVADRYPTVECENGERYLAAPQMWSIEDGGKILAEISQVPLRLAWAVTVHKSQGMTLDSAVIDLSKAFVEGQGYVALSRVKTLDGLFLKGFNKTALDVHPEIINLDQRMREYSEELLSVMKKVSEKKFEKKCKDFLDEVTGKKK